MNLLLVEPYEPLARILCMGMEEEGFAVTIAGGLSQATQLLASKSYDVIILDPPRQAELSVLRVWRRSGLSTPVVLLLTPGSGAEKFKAQGLGPGAHLAKSFQFEDLLTKVRALARPGYSTEELTCDLLDLNCFDEADALAARGNPSDESKQPQMA